MTKFEFKMGSIVLPMNKDFTLGQYRTIKHCLFHIIDFSQNDNYNVLIEPVNKSKFEVFGFDKKPLIISHKKLVPYWVQIGDAYKENKSGDIYAVQIIDILGKAGDMFEYEFFITNITKPFNDDICVQEWELNECFTPHNIKDTDNENWASSK